MAKIFTRGDHYGCECPHCGKNNSYVCQGVTVVFNKITYFQKECFYCKQVIYYEARYEISIKAEKFDPTKT